jgi:hypothetical protein
MQHMAELQKRYADAGIDGIRRQHHGRPDATP